MATLSELEVALVNAHKAGDTDAARKLAAVITRARSDVGNLIPGAQVGETVVRAPEPSLGEKVVGAGEAGLTTLTGGTTGAVGMIGGTMKGLAQAILSGQFGTPQAANLVEQSAMQGAEALTYTPRTPTGQEYAQNVGEVMQQLVPLAGTMPQLRSMSLGAEAAAPIAEATALRGTAAARQAAQRVAQTGGKAVDVVRESFGLEPRAAAEAGGIRGSIGAAATPEAQQRAATAAALPEPLRLTTGQATREAAQLAFEKEQIKNPELGAPLRSMQEEQNLGLLRNFDALYDMTEAQLSEAGPGAVGDFVVKNLASGLARDKAQVRSAYAAAKAAGELEQSVTVPEVINYLNENLPEADLAPILKATRAKALAVGAAVVDEATGMLVPQEVTLAQAENLRKTMVRAGIEPTDQYHGGQLKNIFDAETEGLGGNLYQRARALRREQAEKYENRAVVARLIKNRKGMADPLVAADEVFNRSIMNASPEEIRFLKRIVEQSGPEGPQAWKELQGAAVRHIQEQATKSMQMDSSGNPIVSTAKLHEAVRALDANGRLDIVFGKQRGQIVRDLAEVARYINTVPPGTLINNSGTSMTIMAALAEAGALGATTGLPVPVISGLKQLRTVIQNKQIKAKIDAAVRGLEQ